MVVEHDQTFEQGLAARHLAPSLNVRQWSLFLFSQVAVPREKLAEPLMDDGIRRHRQAKRQRIDEQADHRLNTWNIGRPAGDSRAEHDVRLTAVSTQQQSPSTLH